VNSAVETLSPTRVRLTIDVAVDEMKPSVDAAYKRIAQSITIPGFRRGKVPAAIIDQRVGRAAVLDEALGDIVNNAYLEAVRTNDLKVLAQPDVDISSFEDGQPLSFTVEVEVRPEIELPEYKGIEVSVDDAVADDADVDAQLESLRKRFATLTPVERPAASGDLITLDLAASHDGQSIDDANATGMSYEVGSGDLIDGLDEALTGLEPGGTATVTTQLQSPEWAGKDVQVEVTVRSVRERVLPALDDDFAQLASEFDTIAELRAQVAEQAASIKKIEQALQARDRIGTELLARADVPVPEGLVKAEVDSHLEDEGRLEDDEHRAEVDQDVRRSFQQQLILDEIAKVEDINVTEAELTDYLVRQAARYGMAPDQFVNEVARAGQVSTFVGEVVRGKAMAVVLETAVITDASGRPVDLQALDADITQAAEHDHDHDHTH
jgi:trigger factor